MKITNSIFFNINGGLGKNIMAFGVIDALKKQYPEKDIIILSFYKDVWLNNKNVKDVLSINLNQDLEKFTKENIENTNNILMALEPYSSEDYFYRRRSLIELWCDLYDIKYNGELPKLEAEKDVIEHVKKIINKKDDQKIFLIQTSGGAPNQPYPISWARDLPLSIAEEVCIEMKNKGYRVIHIRRPDQYALKNAEWFDLSVPQIFVLISISNKRLFIDSFPQHAAAALGKPSVVTWVANSPKVFGYKIHTNISPNIKPAFRHTIDSFLEPFNITGSLHEYPYDTDRIYSIDKIIQALDKQKND